MVDDQSMKVTQEARHRTAAQPEREAVLEEAALVAEREASEAYADDEAGDYWIAHCIARSIRALKTTPAPAVSTDDVLAGAIDAAMTDLDLLRRAIEEDDPKAELLIRTTDTWRRLNDAILSPLRGDSE